MKRFVATLTLLLVLGGSLLPAMAQDAKKGKASEDVKKAGAIKKWLGAAQQTKTDWPAKRKDLLGKLSGHLKENGREDADIQKVTQQVGAILDEAHALPPDKFNTARADLTQRLQTALKPGKGAHAGEAGGPDAAAGSGRTRSVGGGQGKGGGGSDAEKREQAFGQWLDKSQEATKKEWPVIRKQILDQIEGHMKQKGKTAAEADEALKKAAAVLDRARALPPAKYTADRTNLVQEFQATLHGGALSPTGRTSEASRSHALTVGSDAGKGGRSSGGNASDPKKREDAIAKWLDNAQQATKKDWPREKKKILGQLSEHMKQKGRTQEQVDEAAKKVEAVLEEARELSPARYDTSRTPLIQKVEGAMKTNKKTQGSGQGKGSKGKGGGTQDRETKIGGWLDGAQQSSKIEWANQKKVVLDKLSKHLKSKGELSGAQVDQILKNLGTLLDEARNMSPAQYKEQRPQLVKRFEETMRGRSSGGGGGKSTRP